MNTRHALLMALAAFSLTPSAWAAPRAAVSSPAEYAFLVPGKTTPGEAIAALGKPEIDYPVYVIAGEIDVLVAFPSSDSLGQLYARAGKRKIVEMRSLEYPIDAYGMARAKLYFLDGRLAYAIVPASLSESTPDKFAARYGATPQRAVLTGTEGHVQVAAVVYPLPELGVALMGDRQGAWKVIFPPRASFP